ncbi:flavin reductase family protein [Mucilaginibacter sp. E4BP6]|uniref:flavin reductase family protein n=1 Tax=Mucilaginibacter sp. E4BP6 TaxID=2723089 RepID=UPI0017BFC332|nr:flavin reductase family protein [Mucilaginibacter sp. E4BP6]NYE67037.1 flavin reductase (DIM6/NTAB) family NADH-FMN oxidoreductase RutF [Mucilaginibacter sp. E4BP6]
MRELAGAVSIITVGDEYNRTGFVATSVSSFSAEPPRIILCISLTSSSWAVLSKTHRFGVNFMREGEDAIASRFTGFGGIKGEARYEGAEWIGLPTGTQVLKDALASIDCTLEESLERHDHAIVIGKVESIRICDQGSPLLWFKSKFYSMGGPVVTT